MIFLHCVVVSGDSFHYQCCLIVHDDVLHCATIDVSSLVHFFHVIKLMLFAFHRIICGVVSLHFFNEL